jgi:trehalose/maltose hydrolase-like predicted phosphorylase
MDELHAPGIEVTGNLELARLVNASVHALLGAYRADSPYSSAPEGLVSTRYSGHAFWDVETWQWPTWLVFWPDQAAAALEYRLGLSEQATRNAELSQIFLHDAPDAVRAKMHLEGMRFPWESANDGTEQCIFNAEDHIVGDISLAFRQYWRATQDVNWLKTSGFKVIKGIAELYASRVSRGVGRVDGNGSSATTPTTTLADEYHINWSLGPDEYHGNITDSAYGNAIGAAALRSAYELASLVGVIPNETFKHIADHLVIPYNATRDYHPEYDEVQWNARDNKLIKQADTVLMYYPLAVENISDATRRNDVRIYSALQDPHGVAMTWGIQTIVSLDIGDVELAAEYFKTGYEVFSRPPFYT